MRDWLARVLFHRPTPPERAEQLAALDAKEREVQTQTKQIRRIRAEARLAELRFNKGGR